MSTEGTEDPHGAVAVGVTPIVRSRADRSAWLGQVFTRAAEIVIAAGALVATAPVMLLTALVIRLDSPGPALFRQTRVGRGRRLFTFYKFRTLYADARERWPHLYAYEYTPDEIEALRFKHEEDPRITRAGRWLRKSTLDELPNFWNLLKGDIAIVGPRPEIPEMLKYYPPEQLALKFSVRPGITGLAQTNGRGNLRFQRTNEYDIEYVRNKSLGLDLKIILRTVGMIFRRHGAF
jgi:lipopolysaccharide/colanic/teichoic acid biosynthesis glycosyltransferase